MKNLPDDKESKHVNDTNPEEIDEENEDEDNNNDDDNESDDETDEEIMNIMKNFIANKVEEEFYFTPDDKPKKKEDNKQRKKGKTLDDCIKEDESMKPKKWASDRAGTKKKVNDVEKIPKRGFRARLPPFRTLDKKQFFDSYFDTFMIQSEESFPSLI